MVLLRVNRGRSTQRESNLQPFACGSCWLSCHVAGREHGCLQDMVGVSLSVVPFSDFMERLWHFIEAVCWSERRNQLLVTEIRKAMRLFRTDL